MRHLAATLLAMGTVIAVAPAQLDRAARSALWLSPTKSAVGPVFAQNDGQFSDDVRFRTAVPWPPATITDDGLVLTLLRREPIEEGGRLLGQNVRMRFDSASHLPRGAQPSLTRCSYFLSNDQTRWITNVPCWDVVRFDDVAPGVSIDVHGRNGVLEYDVIVESGSSAERARIIVEGATGLRVQTDGSLEIETPLGIVRQLPPRAWELGTDGSHRSIATRAVLLGGDAFFFETSGRDPGRPLVIDPGLVYGTFIETSGPDVGTSIAVDSAGAAYVLGEVFTNDFPTTPGAFQPEKFQRGTWGDVVVAKVSADGSSLEYATYLGGSGSDEARKIAVDDSGHAYVVGQAHESDFPTTPGVYSQVCGGSDGFLTKLDATGTVLVFSTLFPGTGSGSNGFNDLAIDAVGRIVLSGGTELLDLPITPGAMQTTVPDPPAGFIVRMLPDGSGIDYCTYVACTALSGVAVGSDMSMFAAGYVGNAAQGLPVTPGAFQTTISGPNEPFALKLDAAGLLQWCTLLGGSNDDRAVALSIDNEGQPVVAGWTQSSNFPTTAESFDPSANGGQDGFLAKLAADGSSLVWATRLGGGSGDTLKDMVTNAAGDCFVLSATASANMPLTPNAFDSSLTRNIEAHIGKLSADGKKLAYGTYFGGSGNVEPVNGIAIDQAGNVYIIGYTSSVDIPTTPGAFDTELSGFSGIYVAKLDLSTWQDVGGGLADWFGIEPRLSANGSLMPLSPGSLHVDQAGAGWLCTVIIGLGELGLPFKGGTMVPMPQWFLPFILNAQGKLDLAWTSWPSVVPPGTSVWFQAWVNDPQSVAGFTATNGLTATVPSHP